MRNEEYFTVVFRKNIRTLAKNPFDVQSDFGTVVGISIGDVMTERDVFYDALLEITDGICDPIAVATAALNEEKSDA